MKDEAIPCSRRPVLVFFFLLAVVCASPALAQERARNVIVCIADGCSAEQYTFARWFKGGPLSFDPFRVGAIRTHAADSVVTDSAPAASAFATGVMTSSGFISVGPHPETMPGIPVPDPDLQYRPVATVLEGAKLMGKATGIVVTSSVTDATPAAYVAHLPRRGMEDDIMEQAVYQNLDVVFGGGNAHLLPGRAKGKGAGREDLRQVLHGKGYRIVETKDEMEMIRGGKAFGLFAPIHMEAEIDRPMRQPMQPSLEEMTRKAISVLSQDPDGFFLMIEGSQIDWACHANDPAHLLLDLLAFEAAVGASLDFARKDGKTLVIVLSDHNTGGFSIGNYSTSNTYSRMSLPAFLAPFRKMRSSAAAMWDKMGPEKTPAALREVLMEGWGLEVTDEDARRVLSVAKGFKNGNGYHAIGEILCPKYTYVGWTTHGHCGGDVPLHAFGPGRPSGVIAGPDVARVCAKAMGLDMGPLNQRLFVDVGNAFGDENVKVGKTDFEALVVTIHHRGKKAELPVNKNWLFLDGKARPLEGVVVYAPKKDRAYIPMQAVRLVKGSGEPLPHLGAK